LKTPTIICQDRLGTKIKGKTLKNDGVSTEETSPTRLVVPGEKKNALLFSS
jgi:hypothetical protein